MMTVAVTGGIGSGKSTVCSLLSGRGIPVYDTDSTAKRLYVEDDSLLDAIEGAFGCSVRLPDGSPDKARLSSIVFSSKEKLAILEGIVHPAVLRDFIRWRTMCDSKFDGGQVSETFFGNRPFCVIESAIILDKPEFLRRVDKVVFVDAPLQTRLRRACGRDGVDPSAIIARMATQRFDLSKVDATIRNDGSLFELESEVNRVFRGLESL